jgi:hypothetical protein
MTDQNNSWTKKIWWLGEWYSRICQKKGYSISISSIWKKISIGYNP